MYYYGIQYSLENQIFIRGGVGYRRVNHQYRIENLRYPVDISGIEYNGYKTSTIFNNIKLV